MSCDVCIDDDGGGLPVAFFRERHHVARVSHSCYECSRTIEPGERYAYYSGHYDRHFWTAHVCAICDEISASFFCGFRSIGGLWMLMDESEVWENLTARSECYRRLSQTAREEILRRWWQWRENNEFEGAAP